MIKNKKKSICTNCNREIVDEVCNRTECEDLLEKDFQDENDMNSYKDIMYGIRRRGNIYLPRFALSFK